MSAALTLLGTVSFRHAEDLVSVGIALPTTKALDLLRLLAGSTTLALGTAYCISLLWPEADEARGRMSLRTALSQLRRTLGPGVVVREGDLLRLGDVETDVGWLRSEVEQLDRLREQGAHGAVLESALALQRHRAADLTVSHGSCEAVHELREELRELRGRALLDGAAAAERLGRDRERLDLALAAARILGSEGSAREVMLAWAALGETSRAVRVFEELQESLHATYGVQPSAETRATYLQIVASGDDAPLQPAVHHRDVVVALADHLVELTRPASEGATGGATGGVVWLLGEPGAGRGVAAREAVRLLARTAPEQAARVLVLPEVIALGDVERDRLLHEAVADGCVLVVPLRQGEMATGHGRERAVVVPPLTREQFHDLVSHLLQELPSEQLEERLWMSTGGLAGLAARTVASLVDQHTLRWTAGSVGPRARTSGLVSAS